MNLKELIGKTEEEASAKIKAANMITRVLKRGAKYFAGTCDMQPNRVNLYIDYDNKVEEAHLG